VDNVFACMVICVCMWVTYVYVWRCTCMYVDNVCVYMVMYACAFAAIPQCVAQEYCRVLQCVMV